MSALDEVRDALHAFAASQGWEIRSTIAGGIAILATINLAQTEVCDKCGRETSGKDFASLGLSVILCSDCYEG